jgi:dihydroorotase
MTIVLRGGRVIDPASGTDEVADVMIQEGRIARIGPGDVPGDADVFDAKGLLVCPGLIDMHVHFREPGYEHKETIATGSRAAAMGGFARVVCEPNTKPPIDDAGDLARVQAIAARDAAVRVHFKSCITVEQQGERLVDVEKVKQAGAVALSDDGEPVRDEGVMERALEAAWDNDILVTPHCEQSARSSAPPGGALRFDREPVFVGRDLGLAASTGARLHISHVSTAEAARLLRASRDMGASVSGEATPHHLVLSADMVPENNPDWKTNPPLRTRQDVEALQRALADGTIQVIATDHAPHAPEEKAQGWDDAPFGMIGLETALGVVFTHLVHRGKLGLEQAIAAMTRNPARILGLEAGSLRPGAVADITLIDAQKEWVVDPDHFQSKGRNCPFAGWKLKGKAVATIVEGKWVMREGQLVA